LAARHVRAVHLESDFFWRFITSGYIEPWKPESHEQNTVVMQIVGDAAAGYARAGYFTVIDGIVSPRWFFQPLRDALTTAGLPIAYVILRPPLPIAIDRATIRSATRLADPSTIQKLWNGFAELDETFERRCHDAAYVEPDIPLSRSRRCSRATSSTPLSPRSTAHSGSTFRTSATTSS
jgi:hypothetical protein